VRNGASLEIGFVGANLPGDGSPITATYLMMAPGSVWETADNGTYTVRLLDRSVEDTLGNSVAATTLGTFTVAIPPPPGRLEVTPPEGLDLAGTVGGPFHPGSLTYLVTNIGDSPLSWTAGKTEAWASLSATSGILAAGASVSVLVSLNDYVNTLQPGDYHNTLSFQNSSTGIGDTSRALLLRVNAAVGFASCSLDEPDTLAMVVQGTAGTEVVLETSTDLLAWTTVVTGQLSPDGTVTFRELTGPDQPNRWYRVRTAP